MIITTHLKRLALGLLLACAGLTAHGQGVVVREDDNSPRKQGATEIIFDNGTVTNQSGGKVRVTNGGGGASAAADVTVAATPSNYTAATQDVEDHLAGVDGALGSVATTANGASTTAATAITDAAAALVRTNHTGLQASTTVTQSQLTWTDTPTIAVAADVNGKLIKGSAATAKTATLIAGIAADVAAFPFANIGTSSWQFIGDGTSVLKDGKNTTVWTGGAGVGATVWPGGSAYVVSEGTNTWRIYQSTVTLHAGADALADDSYEAAVAPITGMVAAATTAQWEAVYINSARKFALADDDAVGLRDVAGVAVAAASADAAVTVLRRGIVRNDGWAWGTVGGPIYLSATPGALTQTQPAPNTKILGYALSDDEAYFDISPMVRVAEVLERAISDETTAITTGTAKITFRMPFAMTLTAVRASLTTVSSSGIPTFDINEGAGAGTTILSTKLTIDASEETSTTAAAAAVISDASLADDGRITIDVDVAGTGAMGAKIMLIGYRTL